MPSPKSSEDLSLNVPQWQIDEVLARKNYYEQHPDELLSWDEAKKMIDSNSYLRYESGKQ